MKNWTQYVKLIGEISLIKIPGKKRFETLGDIVTNQYGLPMQDNIEHEAMSLYAGLWCNGNTQDFGPWIMGSTPVSPTTDNDYVKQIGCATRSLLKTLESFFMKLNWGSKLPWATLVRIQL